MANIKRDTLKLLVEIYKAFGRLLFDKEMLKHKNIEYSPGGGRFKQLNYDGYIRLVARDAHHNMYSLTDKSIKVISEVENNVLYDQQTITEVPSGSICGVQD